MVICRDMLERLTDIRQRFESSAFFKCHEVRSTIFFSYCTNSYSELNVVACQILKYLIIRLM